MEFGRWLLLYVFNDDAAAALDSKRDNAVWSEMLARAGGPTLLLSRRLLYTALYVAAHDKRIGDQTWKLLEPGRKALHLPLGEETLLRKAAQHVVAMKLSPRATREYVRALLVESGHPVRARRVAAVPRAGEAAPGRGRRS